jgi:hypothetical protein
MAAVLQLTGVEYLSNLAGDVLSVGLRACV